MPTILLRESADQGDELDLIDPKTGELTLEAQVVSDFLTHVDFQHVTNLPGMEGFATKAKLDLGEGEEDVELVPGDVVAEAVDLDDLTEMFDHYVQALVDEADEPTASLEQKLVIARLAETLGAIEEAKFPKGRGKMKKAWKGNKQAQRSVVGQMLAMRHKGVYVNKDGKNVKGPGYKTGGTPAGKKKVAAYKAKNKAKGAKAKRLRGVKEDHEIPVEDAVIFGLAAPALGAYYEASPVADAQAVLDERKKKMGKGGMPKPPKGGMDTCEGAPTTRPVIEGANLAAQMLKLGESRSGTEAAALKS